MVSQLAKVKEIRILYFLEELGLTKILYVTTSYTFPCCLIQTFSNNKASFVALFNSGFQIALLGRLTLTKSCLLMHSILVQINRLKYNFGKK